MEPFDGKVVLGRVLPLEVYEVLIPYLGGGDLMNLCLADPQIGERVLEPFQVLPRLKRECRMQKLCLRDLDRAEVLKIFASYENMEILRKDGSLNDDTPSSKEYLCGVKWVNIFMRYVERWNALTEGEVHSQRLKVLEDKLKMELRCAQHVCPSQSDQIIEYSWTTATYGGNVFYNFLTPCPPMELSRINMIDMKISGRKTDCKSTASLCPRGEHNWGLKVIHYPVLRSHNGAQIFDLDQVVISACEKCICSHTADSSKIDWTRTWPLLPETELKSSHVMNRCAAFEVMENIIVIWPFPTMLNFYILGNPSPGEDDGYAFWSFYKPQPTFEGMRELWEEICEKPGHYLCQILDYPGETAAMSAHGKNLKVDGCGYLYHSATPVMYGLAVLSALRGVRIIKPADETFEVIKIEPLYFTRNALRFRSKIQDPCYSAKSGSDIFVFCNSHTIAASWDGVTWIFGSLSFPGLDLGDKDSDEGGVTQIQVLTAQGGLLLVVNQDILLLEMSVSEDFPRSLRGFEDFKDAEVQLYLRPMRVIKTGLASLLKEISHIELNYDSGTPYLFIVAKNSESTEVVDSDQSLSTKQDPVLMRLDFHL